MFRGRKDLTLDAKGRMTMPAKFRDRISEICAGNVVITIDRSECLLIYPYPEWEKVEQKLASLSSIDEVTRRFTRIILHNAEECEMDAQGRFVIPPLLRERAGLKKKVVLAGHANKLELWDEEAYAREQLELWPDLSELPEEVATLAL